LKPVLPLCALGVGHLVAKSSWIKPEIVIDSYELIFVRHGTLGMQEEGREFMLNAGQALLLWPYRVHGGIEAGDGHEHYWIHFVTAGRESSGRRASIQVPRLITVGRPDQLTEMFRRYLDDQESGRLSQVSANLLLAQMLCEISESKVWIGDQPKLLAALASRARTYIHEHFREPVSTALVATALGCSPSYLGKAMRVVYNTTVVQFIHDARVQEARSQLYYTQKSVRQIAHECGFQDAAYMRRVFRQSVGMSPLAIRKLYAREYVTIVD
jgi:AraC-like DNA-binding protein